MGEEVLSLRTRGRVKVKAAGVTLAVQYKNLMTTVVEVE